jgi:hypothetical protein
MEEYIKSIKSQLDEAVKNVFSLKCRKKKINRIHKNKNYVAMDILLSINSKDIIKKILVYRVEKGNIKKKNIFDLNLSNNSDGLIGAFIYSEEGWDSAIHLCDVLAHGEDEKDIYTNGLMVAPDGEPMCRISKNKIEWYLERDLATLVSKDPMTIKLNFEPKGRGHSGDEFYLKERKDICVVCGYKRNLTKHHVMPTCFRRYLSDEIKTHSDHDIVLVCQKHHEQYESKATSLKDQLINDFLNEEEKKDKDKYKYVIDNIDDLDEFIIKWRKHFVKHMKPKFLPDLWDINRKIKK